MSTLPLMFKKEGLVENISLKELIRAIDISTALFWSIGPHQDTSKDYV